MAFDVTTWQTLVTMALTDDWQKTTDVAVKVGMKPTGCGAVLESLFNKGVVDKTRSYVRPNRQAGWRHGRGRFVRLDRR